MVKDYEERRRYKSLKKGLEDKVARMSVGVCARSRVRNQTTVKRVAREGKRE